MKPPVKEKSKLGRETPKKNRPGGAKRSISALKSEAKKQKDSGARYVKPWDGTKQINPFAENRDHNPVRRVARRTAPGESAWVFGRREVVELLECGLETKEILILRSGKGISYDQIVRMAEDRLIPIRLVDRREFDRLFPDQTHQGVAASYTSSEAVEFESLISDHEDSILIILDGVEDPHNLGAVIRSAEVFGANGLIIPGRRATGITPAAMKSSAGAALRFPVATVTNLTRTIGKLKTAGYWIYGLDPLGASSIWDEKFAARICLVFGSEGKGISRLVRDVCDVLVKIPQAGKIGSLNISASAAITLGELSRRREKKGMSLDLMDGRL